MENKIARLTSYGAGKAEFTGLEPNEVEMMQAASNGTAWIRVNDKGRVEKTDTFAPLPQPTDADMEPFWRKNQWVQNHLDLNDFEPLPNWPEPAIIVQHLCGYGYTRTNYIEQAERFKRWGFECLRSRRGTDGKFWEIWYLPGFWMAKEKLKEAIEAAGKDIPERTKAAKNFLCSHSRFGSLDMTNQKLAMVID